VDAMFRFLPLMSLLDPSSTRICPGSGIRGGLFSSDPRIAGLRKIRRRSIAGRIKRIALSAAGTSEKQTLPPGYCDGILNPDVLCLTCAKWIVRLPMELHLCVCFPVRFLRQNNRR
jgi:hypothetical protein